MVLHSTKPNSAGKAAAIRRSKLLTEFRWTPLKDVPTHSKKSGRTVLPAGVEVKGMPYSSAEANDKFIAENVSFETLVSAMANPDSVFYEKCLEGRNSSTYYGIVCNGLVRFCLGITGRYNCKRWGDIPGMYQVKEAGCYTAEEIALCDVLHSFGNGRNHVALITDLLRDESGAVVRVEMSEATYFHSIRQDYDLDSFFEKYQVFGLWRYALIDQVPECDPSYEKILFEKGENAQHLELAVDYGNKSNYLEGEETLISLFCPGEQSIQIRRNGEMTEELNVVGPTRIRRSFPKGYYTITLVRTEETVEFCVNAPIITHTVENEYLTITADPGDSECIISHMEFREAGTGTASLASIEQLSPKEIREGVFTRKIPADAQNYKVSFQNRYGIWTHRMIPIGENRLYSTLPDSVGKANTLKKAAQLTEFRWTPVRDIPTYTKATGKTVLPAGTEVKGMIYSSPEPVDKFITENVSFETLLSAIANPDSVLYHKDLGGNNNSWAYYGIVCNGLARYALGIRGRYSTKRWPTVEGMEMVKPAGAYSVDEIRLCDILYVHRPEDLKRSHVAMITDLLMDENGQIMRVEVSEAVRPSCIRRSYAVEEFFEKYGIFGLWRYAYVDQAPACDPGEEALLAAGIAGAAEIGIGVDHGNKSNYLEVEAVVLSVFKAGCTEMEIRCGEQLTERIKLSGPDRIIRRLKAGYYTAQLLETGETVEFCVNAPKISHTVKNGIITVTADSGDPRSEIYYMDFREVGGGGPAAALAKLEKLTPQERESGVFSREIPSDGAHFKVYFRNRYGVWTHRMIPV